MDDILAVVVPMLMDDDISADDMLIIHQESIAKRLSIDSKFVELILDKSNVIHEKPLGYSEYWVGRYLEEDFYGHFRMKRDTFEALLSDIRAMHNCRAHSGGRVQLSLRKMLEVTVWYLANIECMRSIADRFGIVKSTVHNTIMYVCLLLQNNAQSYIVWPSSTGINNISAAFAERSGLPGVVGAIDGCHIPIQAPMEHQDSYIHRKMQHSIVLQAICDHEGFFIDCFIGYPGSAHDARVLLNSGIHRKMTNEAHNLLPSEDHHILGDSAYPLNWWLLTPFKNYGHMTNSQKKYNLKHSQARVIIENAFGMLKNRFRKLKCVDTKIKNATRIVCAACILHNFCHRKFDKFAIGTDDMDPECKGCTEHPDIAVSVSGVVKRQQIMEQL